MIDTERTLNGCSPSRPSQDGRWMRNHRRPTGRVCVNRRKTRPRPPAFHCIAWPVALAPRSKSKSPARSVTSEQGRGPGSTKPPTGFMSRFPHPSHPPSATSGRHRTSRLSPTCLVSKGTRATGNDWRNERPSALPLSPPPLFAPFPLPRLRMSTSCVT